MRCRKDRDDRANLKILAFACGDIKPTDAEVRFFVKEWMDKPGNEATLMDRDFTYMGFALVASGKGKQEGGAQRDRKETTAAGGAVARRRPPVSAVPLNGTGLPPGPIPVSASAHR